LLSSPGDADQVLDKCRCVPQRACVRFPGFREGLFRSLPMQTAQQAASRDNGQGHQPSQGDLWSVLFAYGPNDYERRQRQEQGEADHESGFSNPYLRNEWKLIKRH
jgi:hypothetical protein